MAISLQPTITLREVLEFLFQRQAFPVPFSFTAIAFDEKRDTGGDILKVDNCIVPPGNNRQPGNSDKISPEMPTRRHNNTINFLNKNNERYIKVHIDLICEFNNQKVVW